MTGDKKPFWSGMSGILAGITALITAIGGRIAVLIQVGVIGGGSSKASSPHATPPAATATGAGDWAAPANVICARTNDAINALPDSNTLTPKAALALLHTNVVLSRQMLRERRCRSPQLNGEGQRLPATPRKHLIWDALDPATVKALPT